MTDVMHHHVLPEYIAGTVASCNMYLQLPSTRRLGSVRFLELDHCGFTSYHQTKTSWPDPWISAIDLFSEGHSSGALNGCFHANIKAIS